MVSSPPQAPPGRYSDQPLSFRTRLIGVGGTTLVALLILGFMFLSWQAFGVSRTAPALNVMNVSPPAAPPAPEKEIPPGPEQERAESRPLEPSPIKPPIVQLPSDNHLSLPLPLPKTDPQPKEATAPPSKPSPPASQLPTGRPSWEGLVLGALNKAKRYPRTAQIRRQQGVPYIRFVIDRSGKVLSVQLERSSGVPALDKEAIALPRRAQPLPKPPEDVRGDTIELVVPVEFFMR